jgi:hypothetical protein
MAVMTILATSYACIKSYQKSCGQKSLGPQWFLDCETGVTCTAPDPGSYSLTKNCKTGALTAQTLDDYTCSWGCTGQDCYGNDRTLTSSQTFPQKGIDGGPCKSYTGGSC